jgi:hypothetical protein
METYGRVVSNKRWAIKTHKDLNVWKESMALVKDEKKQKHCNGRNPKNVQAFSVSVYPFVRQDNSIIST